MKPAAKFAIQVLFSIALLMKKTESLNMVVQVVLIPKVQPLLPLCSLSLLNLLQPLLTTWVTNATLHYVPDFKMQELVLTYQKTSLLRDRRQLRGGNSSNENDEEADPRALITKLSPTSCTTCSSGGCSTYCASATCSLCSSKRRLTDDSTLKNNMTLLGIGEDPSRNLYAVNFATLGPLVSANVQASLQNFLTTVLDLLGLGCLGNPSYVKTNVTYLVNQTLVVG